MKKRLPYIFILTLAGSGIFLTAFSPDIFSMAVSGVMLFVVLLGCWFGIVPLIQYRAGFLTANQTIARVLDMQTDTIWTAVQQTDPFFYQRALDKVFREYKRKVSQQRNSDQVMSDIDEYISDDAMAVRSWRGVIIQIPGTLTGLGLLGTFMGLLFGIHDIAFSTVEATIISIQTLINGIQIAFYTSIAGVILSILFNISYRMVWNMAERERQIFVEDFHRHIVPSVEEQVRYRERREKKQILEYLDRIPRNFGTSGKGFAAVGSGNEQVMMPQIRDALINGEFIFYLQPRFDLATRKINGAEALVRWNHKKLGVLSPAVFVPLIEQNGYIVKVDQYIWEQVCMYIRKLLDNGMHPAPISVKVSKTDMMALDIASFFKGMLGKYKIPPYMLEAEIPQDAYITSYEQTRSVAEALQQIGIRTLVGGFNGDYMALTAHGPVDAAILKLDIFSVSGGARSGIIDSIVSQARTMNCLICVVGIESMEQLQIFRKAGCDSGQGYVFCKPMTTEMYEERFGRAAEGEFD